MVPDKLDNETRHFLENVFLESHESGYPNILTGFLSGSYAEGLATTKSDYDLYAVVDDQEHAFSSKEIFVPSKKGLIEITYISNSYLSHITEVMHQGFSVISELGFYDLLLLHRIVSSINIFNNELNQKLSLFVDRNKLAQYLVDWFSVKAAKSLTNMMGNLEAGDIDTAINNIDMARCFALDAYLAIHGNTSFIPKWRLSNAKIFLGENDILLLRFKELAALPFAFSFEMQLRYLTDACRFIQLIFDFKIASELKWKMVEISKIRLWGIDEFHPPHEALIKNPRARILQRENNYYLFDSAARMELSLPAVYIWLTINNQRGVREVIECLINGKEPFDASEEFIDGCIRRFISIGVVSLWCTGLQK